MSQRKKRKSSTRITDDYIIFSSACFLCQWCYAPFVVNDIKYFSSEQWMMAEKARLMDDPQSLKQILNVKLIDGNKDSYKRAAQCHFLGRNVKPWDQQKWDKHKQNIVFQGNLYKFQQNPKLAKKLLSYDHKKTFVSYGSSPWGIGIDIWDLRANSKQNWKGDNLLGIVITNIRDQLLMENNAIKYYPAPDTIQIMGEDDGMDVELKKEEENKTNDEDKGYKMVLLDLMNESMNEKQAEFQKYFYRNFQFDSIATQNKYYKKLLEFGVNSLELLMCCDDQFFVKETLGLNFIHSQLFMQRVDILKKEYKIFEHWLHEIKMNEYLNVFRNKGILTFELFYATIDGFQDLMNIIGTKNQIDAHFIWDSTPKATRHKQLQSEGQ